MTENEILMEMKEENKECLEDCEGVCHEIEDGKCACRDAAIVSALEELKEYRSIGTVSECREAVEKQRAKKPILCMNEVSGMFVDYADGHGEYKTQMNNWWRCPCYNEVVGQRVIVHKHIHDQRKKKYCEKCGQAISWERDNE